MALQQEQIQCIDTKIQEILATRKKYISLENLHKKQSPCLDETKASSSTSSQTRIGAISGKFLKGNEREANEIAYKPRVIRTTTPYKNNGKNCKLTEKNGKFNFEDINRFKRVENDEKLIMGESIKPKAFGKSEHKNQEIGFLPVLEKFNEKLTFTGTFNPHFGVKTNGTNGNKQEFGGQTGYFKLEDAVKTKGIFQNKAKVENAASNEELAASKQKNFGRFPKDVFAINVKRKFFV